MRTRSYSPKLAALALGAIAPLLFTADAARAQDGSLARCGSLSAPVGDVIHHCRRAISRGGLKPAQEFAANLNLGDALLSTGKPRDALAAYEAAAALGLERVELYLGRAEAEEQMGERQAAVRDLDRALALVPNSVDVRLSRGSYYLRAGQLPAALEEFDNAVRLDSGDVNSRYQRGLTLIQMGRGREAVADFSRVIEDYPNDAGAWYNRARAQEADNPRGALADYDRAIALNPEWPVPFFVSGRFLDAQGNKAEADRRFRRAFELGYKDPWLLQRIRSMGG